MSAQLPASNVARYLDIGNAIVYIAKAKKTSFSSAVSATDYRKLGVLESGLQIDVSKAQVQIKSGVPQRLIKTFYTEENMRISGAMLEFSPFNLSRALGGLALTVTTKSSSPAATTVATGSTKTVVNVASSSGYAVGDLIEVGNTGAKQYGVIASISGNALTLVEALDNDANPTTGHAVAKVDTVKMNGGAIAAPTEISLKISKTMTGGFGTLDVYILNAIADGNVSFGWRDNGNVDPSSIPFAFDSLSDANVESGAIFQTVFTQS